MNDQYSYEVYQLNTKIDFIIDPVNNLVIEVIPPEDNFTIDNSEVQYYGSDYEEPFTFQTVGYMGQDAIFIEAAIMWYATEIFEYPDMKLSKEPK
jgi:hypothetical protein